MMRRKILRTVSLIGIIALLITMFIPMSFSAPVDFRQQGDATSTSVTLEWNAPEGVIGYSLVYYANGIENPANYSEDVYISGFGISLDSSTTSYVFEGLSPFTNYKFRLYPYFDASEGPFYDQNVSTPAANPWQLGLSVKERADDTITVNWVGTDVTPETISYYKISCAETAWNQQVTEAVDVQSCVYEQVIPDLDAATLYTLSVSAYDQADQIIGSAYTINASTYDIQPIEPDVTFVFDTEGATNNILAGSGTSMQYSIDGGSTWINCGTNTDLNEQFDDINASGDVRVRIADNGTNIQAGEVRRFDIRSAPAISCADSTADKLVGITGATTLEARKETAPDTWSAWTQLVVVNNESTTLEIDDGQAIQIRDKAVDNTETPAGMKTEITAQAEPSAPTFTAADATTNKLIGLPVRNDLEYSIDAGTTWHDIGIVEANGVSASLSQINTSDSVEVRIKASYPTPAGQITTVVAEEEAAAPVGSILNKGTLPGKTKIISVDDTMEYSVDGTSYTSVGAGQTSVDNITADAEQSIYVRYKTNGTHPPSVALVIEVTLNDINEAAAPSAPALAKGTNAGTTKLTNIDTTMEYKINSGEYTTVSGTEVDNLAVDAGTHIFVRVKETSAQPASLAKDITVGLSDIKEAAAPAVTFSFSGVNANKLMNSTTAMEYSINGGSDWILCSANTDLTGANITAENDIRVRVKETVTQPSSNITIINITSGPVAPTFTSADSKEDILKGLPVGATNLQGRVGTGAWISLTVSSSGKSTSLSFVAGNIIGVRVKANETVLPGAIATCTAADSEADGGGGGGSGGGGSGTATEETAPAALEDTKGIVVSTESQNKIVGATVSLKADDSGHVNITQEQLKDILSKIEDIAKQKDTVSAPEIGVVEARLTINAELVGSSNNMSINIPKEIVEASNKNTIEKMEIINPIANLIIPTQVLNNANADSYTVGTKIVDTVKDLTPEQKANVGDNPVYDFSITAVTKDGNVNISTFSSAVEVELPYKLKANENPNKITVYFLNDKGELENVQGTYDSVTGTVHFTTKHFSKYIIKLNDVSFSDLENVSWAKACIESMAAKEIVKGMKDDKFEPNGLITRAQFAALLVRVLKLEDDNAESTFADVYQGAWYYSVVALAAKHELIKGYEDGTFRPENTITRQDMAVMIERAIKAKTQSNALKDGFKYLAFSDSTQIMDYAKNSVGFVVKYGIIKGKDGNRFDPQSNATRAEAAKVISGVYSLK